MSQPTLSQTFVRVMDTFTDLSSYILVAGKPLLSRGLALMGIVILGYDEVCKYLKGFWLLDIFIKAVRLCFNNRRYSDEDCRQVPAICM